MIVTSWNNGDFNESGSGYGIRIKIKDRGIFFQNHWKTIQIGLEGENEQISVRLSPSFWKKCPELRHMNIGKWFLKNGIGKWKKQVPYHLILNSVEDGIFFLSYRQLHTDR